MKNIAFLIGGIFLFFSCVNEESKKNNEENSENKGIEQSSTDSLPETEWNGEYLKIKDGDEPKIKRKSQGSDFYSMGRVEIKIEKDSVDFKLFERKKNVLTFTNESITAFVRSAFEEDVKVVFRKKDIVVNHKGKYKVDASGKANNSVLMTIKAGEKSQQKEFTMESGIIEIIHFSPKLGLLELKIDGTFKDSKGASKKGGGMIKMNFEEAVMTAV
ncbi:hypothetical protein [Brumimicrobium mesophilum]|uniref:hypothetical protein n=1 Tax=Brumimicrobium mesophilum TaxID=392717 RepID=UPI000D1401F8|nr:hypothetical protein [Brumimicrobium mesophilum]